LDWLPLLVSVWGKNIERGISENGIWWWMKENGLVVGTINTCLIGPYSFNILILFDFLVPLWFDLFFFLGPNFDLIFNYN
jgi:hypothetical protein